MANEYSVGEQIVQALADALNAPADKPCTFFRTRVEAFASSELPAAVVYALKEDPQRKAPNVVVRERTVRIEVLVAGEPPADRLADPIYLFIVRTLWQDDKLGDLICGLNEAQIQWETEASYQDACIAAIDFTVVFKTETTDPTVRVP